jgi:hypothetical protein
MCETSRARQNSELMLTLHTSRATLKEQPCARRKIASRRIAIRDSEIDSRFDSRFDSIRSAVRAVQLLLRRRVASQTCSRRNSGEAFAAPYQRQRPHCGELGDAQMTSLKSKLERLDQWIDADDAKLMQRPTRWHVAKVIIGAVMLVKSIGLFRHATGLEGFALAGLLLAGAIALIAEGIRLLRAGPADPNP